MVVECSGPRWQDVCGHGGYVGSFLCFQGGDWRHYDLYVFGERQQICLRFSNEGNEYHSFPWLRHLLAAARSGEPYASAVEMLWEKGQLRWTPNSAASQTSPASTEAEES